MSRLPFRRNTRLLGVLIPVVGFIACALLTRIGPGATPDFSDTRGIFRFHDGVWIPSPPLPGGVCGLQVSSRGAVWTVARSRGGLSRVDGARWTRYSATDFGGGTNWIRGGFALNEEEVWGATDKGVVRFDGQHWRVYKDALKTDKPLVTVAGPSGVWVVDDDANLSHFDGTSWSIQNLNETLSQAPSGGGEDTDSPDLTMTGDSRLWILWHGLWRQEGDTWRAIRPGGVDLTYAYLIGHDAERVWLRLGWDEIAAVSADGKVAARFGGRDLGISERVRINGLAAAGGRIWLAINTGLLEFDGGRWHDVGRPPGTVVVTDVAVGPDGAAWVVAEKRPLGRIALWVAPPLAGCAGALIVIGLLITMWLRARVENRLAADQALANAAGYLPGVDLPADRIEVNRQARSMAWKLPAALVVFPFVTFTVSLAARFLQRHWPDVPAWAAYAGVLTPTTLAGAGIWLWVRNRRRPREANAPPPRPSRYKQTLWGPAQRILLVSIFLFVFSWSPLGWIDRVIQNSAVAYLLKLAVTIFVVGLVVSGRDIVAQFLVRGAWRAGDYDRALNRIRRLSFGRPTFGMLRLEGLTHSLAGRLAEAEQCYRQALAKSQGQPRSARREILGCLGDALTQQGRYEEARRCLEGAVEMGDSNGSSRVTIAEGLLAQEIEPQKALDLIDQAMRVSKSQIARRLEGRRWALKAWALALLGRRQEAEDAITRALQANDPKFRPLVASRHWTIGKALMAMERTGKAIEHFRAARDADPKGRYGSLALEQLKQHSVWGQ